SEQPSGIGKYLKGWSFRTGTPSFEEGNEFEMVLTEYDEEEGTVFARIGDSMLYLEGDMDESDVGKKVRAKITEFDENAHVGWAELLAVIGGSELT
ncbi:MAG: hypothetical protein ABEJ60_04700, partial [Halodesulfurarchaeum sp.]